MIPTSIIALLVANVLALGVLLVLVWRDSAKQRRPRLAALSGCGCGYGGEEPHDFVVTAPPGYGYVHSPCRGVRVSGFPVALGSGQAASRHLRGLPVDEV